MQYLTLRRAHQFRASTLQNTIYTPLAPLPPLSPPPPLPPTPLLTQVNVRNLILLVVGGVFMAVYLHVSCALGFGQSITTSVCWPIGRLGHLAGLPGGALAGDNGQYGQYGLYGLYHISKVPKVPTVLLYRLTTDCHLPQIPIPILIPIPTISLYGLPPFSSLSLLLSLILLLPLLVAIIYNTLPYVPFSLACMSL